MPRLRIDHRTLACISFALVLAVAVLAGQASAGAARDSCLRIDRVESFAPRGEVYVRVAADCEPSDFAGEPSIIAYLEVYTPGARARGEDVRIYPDAPDRGETFAFQGLEIESGDPLLVRLTRFGEILDLETVKVP